MRVAPTAIVLATFTLLTAAAVQAAVTPVTPYEPEHWVVSASLGFGVADTYGGHDSPLIGLSAEYGVNDKISVGGSIGHTGSRYSYYDPPYNYEWKYGYTVIAARGSYHFGDQLNVQNMDAYAGLSLGYNIVSVSEPSNLLYRGYTVGDSYLLWGIHGGARYWFTPKVAGFGEVGFGLGNLVLGVSTRF